MTPDDPRHGTYAGLIQHGRDQGKPCEPCREAGRRYYRSLKVRTIMRQPRIVSAARARAHIARCLSLGMVLEHIVKESGSEGCSPIHSGQLTQILATTERRILAVKPTPGVNCWPADGAARRLRALAVMGHRQATVASRLGRLESWVSETARNRRGHKRIDPGAWCAIRDLYDELWNVQGDPALSRRAVRKGWDGPLAWDDATIDDPAARPQGVGTERLRSAEETAEEVEHLLKFDPLATADSLGQRLGYTGGSGVQNALKRAARRDLLDLLARNAELAGHSNRRPA